MKEKLSTAELRRRNRSNVYQYFYQAETPRTKQDIANDLGLSLPTVTQNLRELMEAGLIVYAGLDASSGGRRARTMRLNADARISVGVELSPKHIRLVATNLLGQEIAYQQLNCMFSSDAIYRTYLAQEVERFLDEFHLDREALLGIGITLPGIVDEAAGVIEVAPVLGIRRMALQLFTDLLPYPVYMQNDASAGGYAEWRNRSELDNMAYLSIGKGVGGALLIDGEVYEGSNRRSGEFGHMCLVPGGRECKCGKCGCFEAYCSTARLSDDLDIRTETFFELLAQKNGECMRVWENYLDHLTRAINNIRMVFDCNVVLGGALTPYLEPYLSEIRRRLHELNAFGDEGSYFYLGKCRAKANCIGVAMHFVDDFVQRV